MPAIAYIVAFLLAATGAVLLARWTARQPAEDRLRYVPWVLFAVLLVVIALLAANERNHWLIVLVAAFAPFVQRIWAIARNSSLLSGWLQTTDVRTLPWSGHVAELQTPYLRMDLEHDTGAIDAAVLQGDFQGQRLSDLTLGQLLSLRKSLGRSHPDSAALVEAYLHKVYGTEWHDPDREIGPTPPPPAPAELSQEEALRLLGLDQASGERDVVDAHQRLMRHFHPERGGSEYLARRIEQAKERLLDA